MPRRLTGFTPSGHLHLGNYIGAIRPIVAEQAHADTVVFVSDLHALTLEHDPVDVRARTLEFVTLLLAAGADPDTCLMIVQSHVPEHTELHYLLECTTGYGEAQRMIQFREKSRRQEHVRMSLLTYPILMAADILLYDTEEVPVGADQSQHVELARDIATRFNTRYGPTFTVPRAVNPPVAARIMDLAVPTTKMSKSAQSVAGSLRMLDEPEALRRTVIRAVTDTDDDVAYEPIRKPGVSNLLTVLAACTGDVPTRLAGQFDRYGPEAGEPPSAAYRRLRREMLNEERSTCEPPRHRRRRRRGAAPRPAQARLRGGHAQPRRDLTVSSAPQEGGQQFVDHERVLLVREVARGGQDLQAVLRTGPPP